MRKTVGFAALCAACVLGGTFPAAAQKMPVFTGLWTRLGVEAHLFEKPPTGTGPLMNLYKSTSLRDSRAVGDYKNPILQPWAAEIIKKNGDDELADHGIVVPHNICWPEGVPGAILLRESVQFLQTPSLITILYQRDHQFRQIFLNQEHSKNYTPSWYGELVGHYEGDTLVVDTIGIKVSPRTFVDGFGSPHTAKLHVVERYRVVDGGKAIQALATVDDPGVFTMPWVGMGTYTRTGDLSLGVGDPFEENVCSENNRNPFGKGDWDIPFATKSDF